VSVATPRRVALEPLWHRRFADHPSSSRSNRVKMLAFIEILQGYAWLELFADWNLASHFIEEKEGWSSQK
jgi:hypothetical protein